MRTTFETMGTVASLTGERIAPELLRSLRAGFDAWEHRFSLYRADSELSRIADGSLRLLDASDELRATYALAIDWQLRTVGAFTPHRPDGIIDLNGVVKALATAEAGETLGLAGVKDWSLNVGGDLLCSGTAPGGGAWLTGIVDPSDRHALLCAVAMTPERSALATSGRAERGDHIWGLEPTRSSEFAQVSVLAADIVTADVLATAIVAGGTETLDRVTASFAVDVLAVGAGGKLVATPGFSALLAPATL